MTCIAGIADGKRVWIGGDSAGIAGWQRTIRADSKVFVNGPMVFGFTTSFRMGQLLRHALQVPKQHEGDDAAWLTTTFVDAVRTCLKDGGFAKTESGAETGGSFLVGYRGRLYEVAADYQIGEPVDQYASVGCGDEFALGNLFSSKGTPESRIAQALDASAHFSAAVSGPFTVVSGGES